MPIHRSFDPSKTIDPAEPTQLQEAELNMTAPSQPSALPFQVLNAFTDRPDGGNPAGVMFLPPSATPWTALPTRTLAMLAQNVAQPVTAFICPTGSGLDDAAEATFATRWFTVEQELAICGHATLAAAQAVFAQRPALRTLRFESTAGRVLVARRAEDERIEIALEASTLRAMVGEEANVLRTAVTLAYGDNVGVNFMGRGEGGFERYVLVELDTSDLGGLKVDKQALVASNCFIHVITGRSANPRFAFESRMFYREGDVIKEDAVCGSAHSLLGPYWAKKGGLNREFMAKQVSARGGDLKVRLDPFKNQIALAGEVTLVAKGEIYL